MVIQQLNQHFPNIEQFLFFSKTANNSFLSKPTYKDCYAVGIKFQVPQKIRIINKNIIRSYIKEGTRSKKIILSQAMLNKNIVAVLLVVAVGSSCKVNF